MSAWPGKLVVRLREQFWNSRIEPLGASVRQILSRILGITAVPSQPARTRYKIQQEESRWSKLMRLVDLLNGEQTFTGVMWKYNLVDKADWQLVARLDKYTPSVVEIESQLEELDSDSFISWFLEERRHRIEESSRGWMKGLRRYRRRKELS